MSLERSGQPRRVRVVPEYWSVWPLWEFREGLAELTPAELGLSEEVTRAVRAWRDFWGAHCEEQMRWDSPEHKARFLERGAELVRRIQADAGPGWVVEGVPGASIPGTPITVLPRPRAPVDKPTGWWGLPPRE